MVFKVRIAKSDYSSFFHCKYMPNNNFARVILKKFAILYLMFLFVIFYFLRPIKFMYFYHYPDWTIKWYSDGDLYLKCHKNYLYFHSFFQSMRIIFLQERKGNSRFQWVLKYKFKSLVLLKTIEWIK